MGLLYKKAEDVNVSVIITEVNGRIEFEFSADSGKHHTEEVIAGFSLSPKRLLEILSDAEILDDELETGAADIGMRVIVVGASGRDGLNDAIAHVLAKEKGRVSVVVCDSTENTTEVNKSKFENMIMKEIESFPILEYCDVYKPSNKGHERPYKFHR